MSRPSASSPVPPLGIATRGAVQSPLPRGARDLLPDAARLRRKMIDRLLASFERWGYVQVITPSVEYYDVVVRGLGAAQRARCVRFIEPGSGEVVALPPDITPQIARMVATRWGGDLPPSDIVRLSYSAAVVRQPDGHREQAEHHQVGVELVGDPDAEADAELIALCHESLAELGLRDVRLDLAHTAIAREILDAVGLDAPTLTALHGLLACKDEDGTMALLTTAGVQEPMRSAVAALCHLYGPPEVLDTARRVLMCRPVVSALDRLAAVLDALRVDAPDAWEQVVVDLGEVRGFDYYTGFRLRVWAAGAAGPVASGGRYNDMLARYGASVPATGFAIDLDTLEAALAHAGVSAAEGDGVTAVAVVVSPACGASTVRTTARRMAAAAARDARSNGARAWIQIGQEPALARERARAAGAERLVYVDLDDVGNVTSTCWRLADDDWIEDASQMGLDPTQGIAR